MAEKQTELICNSNRTRHSQKRKQTKQTKELTKSAARCLCCDLVQKYHAGIPF